MTGIIHPLDLNDLEVFDKVATLASFSAAARALGLPKSKISRDVARLEAALGARLFQRTTRRVVLTEAGEALKVRSTAILAGVEEAFNHVSGLSDRPRGQLRITSGIGFGVNVLADLLPEFMTRYPEIQVTLTLSSHLADLVSEGVDCAIRLGPLPDSGLVATRLGVIDRNLCAATSYVARRGRPRTPEDLLSHDVIEMPGPDGRPQPWVLSRDGRSLSISVQPRILVDEALAIFRLVQNGGGIAIVSRYLATPEIVAGRLVQILPEWTCQPLPVSLIYPSRRELAPTVRAFADFMKEASSPGKLQRDLFAS